MKPQSTSKTRFEEGEEGASITCLAKAIIASRPEIRPYCRGAFAAIEATIHATRLQAYLNQGRLKEAEESTELIRAYKALIDRTAPNSSYSSIVDSILSLIESWKRGHPPTMVKGNP